MSSAPTPRAVGRRMPFAALPGGVSSWVRERFGAVRVAASHIGGMSPGCAATLELDDGRMVFLKAVGSPLNPQTPDLFRHEAAVLRCLPPAGYRPPLIDVYDDGDWVALAMDHVVGRYPDLGDDQDFHAVLHLVEAQRDELTPAPGGTAVGTLALNAAKWLSRWAQMADDPRRFLPGWAAGRFAELHERVGALPNALTAGTLCHFDVRDDNLLIRPDRTAVIVDWGQARLGPGWADLLLLALQKPTAEEADGLMRDWIPPDQADLATDLLIALGGSQAWNAAQPPRPSMPAFAAFAREDTDRILAVVRVRLLMAG